LAASAYAGSDVPAYSASIANRAFSVPEGRAVIDDSSDQIERYVMRKWISAANADTPRSCPSFEFPPATRPLPERLHVLRFGGRRRIALVLRSC